LLVEAGDGNADWIKTPENRASEAALHARLAAGLKGGTWVTIDDRPVMIGGPGSGGGGGAPVSPLRQQLISNPVSISPEGQYQQGTTPSFLVDVEDDGRAIVKPDPYDYAEGTSGNESVAMAEQMAYELAQDLGFDDLVPVTVARPSGDKLFAVQEWKEHCTMPATLIDEAYEVHGRGLLGPDLTTYYDRLNQVPPQRFADMMVLDILIGNHDRHTGNWLLSNDDPSKLFAIDNGYAFRSGAQTVNAIGAIVRDASNFGHFSNQIRFGMSLTEAHKAGIRRVLDGNWTSRIRFEFGYAAGTLFETRANLLLEQPETFFQAALAQGDWQ
jgi:hypothetical protein